MSGWQTIMCSRSETCKSEMQHSKYVGLKVRAISRALKVSANKARTKVWPFSICSRNISNPMFMPLRFFGNMTWPKIASSKAKTRLRLHSWYEQQKLTRLLSIASFSVNKLQSRLKRHWFASFLFPRILSWSREFLTFVTWNPDWMKVHRYNLYRKELPKFSNILRWTDIGLLCRMERIGL